MLFISYLIATLFYVPSNRFKLNVSLHLVKTEVLKKVVQFPVGTYSDSNFIVLVQNGGKSHSMLLRKKNLKMKFKET